LIFVYFVLPVVFIVMISSYFVYFVLPVVFIVMISEKKRYSVLGCFIFIVMIAFRAISVSGIVNVGTISRRGSEASVYFSEPRDRSARSDRPAWIATLRLIFNGPRRKSRRYLLFSDPAAASFALLVPRPGVEAGRKNAFGFIPRGKTRFDRN